MRERLRDRDGGNLCESGGIGRRTRLRIWRVKPWGFESPLSHQSPGFPRLAHHSPEHSMPKASGLRALHKLQFAATLRLHPFTLFHLLGTNTVARPVRLRQVHERTLAGDERLQFAENLLAEMRREAPSDPLDVVEIFSSIFPDD